MRDPLPLDLQPETVPPPRGHRLSRRRGQLDVVPADGPPDLAAVARAAVIGYLRDESAATSEQDATLAGGPATADVGRDVDEIFAAVDETMPVVAGPADSEFAPHTVALRAAALSLATLDRIELAAAKLEADIAVARAEQAEVRAGAGAAAEIAVNSAQQAWLAAAEAEESSAHAKESLRRIGRYMAITVALVLLQLLIAGVFASAAH
jgi:hypothetical protein